MNATLNKDQAIAILQVLEEQRICEINDTILSAILTLRQISKGNEVVITMHNLDMVKAIKTVRCLTGMHLKESKDFVETFAIRSVSADHDSMYPNPIVEIRPIIIPAEKVIPFNQIDFGNLRSAVSRDEVRVQIGGIDY